jgi:hypothetical protein
MNRRKLLWLALGALGLPIAIEGTMGCGFTAPGAAPIEDNAYTCGCRCAASPSDKSFVIATAADDADQTGATVDLARNGLDLGGRVVGLRFTNLAIPAGATIASAAVQFTALQNDNQTTNVTIVGELSPNAEPFAAVDDNLTDRAPTVATVAWAPGPWGANGDAGPNQRTPALAAVIQELVNQQGWTSASPVVLRFDPVAGQRSAISFDRNPARVAVLQVTFAASVRADIPVCTTPEIAAQRVLGAIPAELADADCKGRVTDNLEALAGACGYPTGQCACDLVFPDQGDASFQRNVCDAGTCDLVPTDATCSNFDPNGFWQCIQAGGTEASCAPLVAANGVAGGAPVCLAVDRAPGMAARVFGNHSTCQVEGTSHIEVGDREPEHDPDTTGTVDILGDPCAGGGCRVAASLGLAMDPITFSVRFASDPTFHDLSASADTSLATLDGVNAVFAEDTVGGTGNGRRGTTGLSVSALNQQPLTLGVDWAAHACDLNGNVASTVDGEVPDGTCEGDDSIPCTADSPDCDDVGGPCNLEDQDLEPMTVNVSLAGSLVNQPPAAASGADQTVECTSTAGATFTLQGSATDPDQNVALTSWRAGSRIGPEVSRDLVTNQTLGVGAQQTYVLRVLDGFAQGAEADTHVAVVDTTPPQLSVSVSPAQLWPPNHKLRPVTATITVTDTCDANPVIRLVSITSNEADNGAGDGNTTGDIQGAAFGTDDRAFLLRAERSGNGNGRIYTITYSATDASGNTTLSQATVTVPH